MLGLSLSGEWTTSPPVQGIYSGADYTGKAGKFKNTADTRPELTNLDFRCFGGGKGE